MSVKTMLTSNPEFPKKLVVTPMEFGNIHSQIQYFRRRN